MPAPRTLSGLEDRHNADEGTVNLPGPEHRVHGSMRCGGRKVSQLTRHHLHLAYWWHRREYGLQGLWGSGTNHELAEAVIALIVWRAPVTPTVVAAE